jgi:C4-dicarboxylate transporter DctM subunit
MGELLVFTQVSKDAFEVINKWLGRLPGGLAVSGIGACALFAAINGSSPATTATIGLVSVPEMLNRGYNKRLATGSIAAGGALGILIPPSILMIVYGVASGTSVGQLFMAGFIPGIMLAGIMMLYIVIRCRLSPNLAPLSEHVSWSNRLRSTWKILPAILLATLVLSVIYLGIATPTEAGAIGAFGAFLLAIISRRFTWSRMHAALLHTVTTSAFILFIVLGAHFFGYMLSHFGIPQGISETISKWDVSRWWIMIAFNFVYLILGCLMDPTSIILVTGPIVIPIVQNLGFDLVWFGIIFTLNMEMANITPPVGFNLYVMKGIVPENVSLTDIILGSLPFVVLQAAALALIMIFPKIALWLPSMMKVSGVG